MKVSVVMAAYNAERYIREAIDSILSQSFTDFEFIIVNDGSNDGTKEILEQYTDPRVHIVHQSNQGCASARNRAIALAKGKYLAIMDADDISWPERLRKTVDYLDSHPSTVIVSTGFIIRNDDTGEEKTVFHPSEDKEIRRALLRDATFLDPSNLIRADAFRKVGGYQLDYMFDYELYSRLARVGNMANIPEVLAILRQHKKQFYRLTFDAERARKTRLKIRWLSLWRIKPPLPLFVKTFIWLCFEYLVHLFPQSLRHKLPESFRGFFKRKVALHG
ncbi:MAG: glycosyltransferase [Deltaproteobacteria bacterium]|nr:glycosyltransferase [Deltaproteobacteria bacterium]